MIQLSAETFLEAGFSSLTGEQANDLAKDLYESLESAVGRHLGELLTAEELELFGEFIDPGRLDANTERIASDWLDSRIPDLPGQIQLVFETIMADLRALTQSAGDAFTDSADG